MTRKFAKELAEAKQAWRQSRKHENARWNQRSAKSDVAARDAGGKLHAHTAMYCKPHAEALEAVLMEGGFEEEVEVQVT